MLYEYASKLDDGDVVELSELSLFSTFTHKHYLVHVGRERKKGEYNSIMLR